MSDAVREAMAETLAEIPASEPATDVATVQPPEVANSAGETSPATATISADEAEKLLRKAFRVAQTFTEVMATIIEKKAWEPLGYHSPQELIRSRFVNHLVNPVTGNTYSASQIRRMANLAGVVWKLAEETGVPASEIPLTLTQLAAIPSGDDHQAHTRLVGLANGEIERRGAETDEEKIAAIRDTVNASVNAGEPTAPAPQAPVFDMPAPTPEVTAPHTPSEATELGDDPAAPPTSPTTPQRPASGGEVAPDPEPAPVDGGGLATAAFDAETPTPPEETPGERAPKQRVSMEDAINRAQRTDAVVDGLGKMETFVKRLESSLDGLATVAGTAAEILSEFLAAGENEAVISVSTATVGLLDPLDDNDLIEVRRRVAAIQPQLATIQAAIDVVGAVELPEGDLAERQSRMVAGVERAREVSDLATALERLLSEVNSLQPVGSDFDDEY